MISIFSDVNAAIRAFLRSVLLSLAVLSLVSCGKPNPSGDEPAPENPAVPAPEGSAMTGAKPSAVEVPAPAAPVAAPGGVTAPGATMAPGTGAAVSPYATAGVLINDLIAKLQAGDWNGFLELAGPQANTEGNRGLLRKLLVDKGYQLAENPVAVTDRSDTAKLCTVKFRPKAAAAALGEQQVEMDLAMDPGSSWAVKALRVPDLEKLAATAMGAAPGAAQPGGPGDPLTVAGQFLTAVVAKDFATARRTIDTSKLSDEKLAALFIVVEEGSFKAHRDKPLISTLARNNVAWVIARLESASQQSDFGIEMSRAAESSPWQIVGLNFSKLIQKVAAQAGAGDIAYSPLQTDLKGGEQIVIYFEFDGTVVNPRAEKQLRIIGDILRADSKRTLTINGHTDALGMDGYNKDLSERRADAVREFLTKYGIPGPQIITQGFGKAMPKAPNVNPDGTDNPSGRAQNRRAEVYLKF